MHFHFFAISFLAIFAKSYSQGGYPQPQYDRTSFSNSQQGYQQPLPYRTEQPRYRVFIRPLPFQTSNNDDHSPPYPSSPSHAAPTFEDSPDIETASSDENVPTHQSFPVREQFAANGERLTPVQGAATIENSAENFGAPLPVTEAISEPVPVEKDDHDLTVEEGSAQNESDSERTQITEGSGADGAVTDIETAGGATTLQPSVVEGSGAPEIVTEDLRTDATPAGEAIAQEEAPNHSQSKDSISNDRIVSDRDSALRDGGRVAETIDAANIRFFNRSEISTLCFQTSQNNARNGRLQKSENALVVAQCLMDTPPQPQICNPVDIMFVVDGSGSIGEENFVIIKNWIRQFVNTYLDTGSAERQSQVGVIEFSDAAFVQVPLGGYAKEKVLTDIGTTPYQGGATEIGLALNLACQEFSQNDRDRSYAKNVMILLTDGHSDDQRSIINGVACATSKNIDIVAIGIGNQFNESQLSFITDHKANRLFSIASFIGLDENLAEDLCKKITDVDTTTDNIRCPVPQSPNSDCSNSVVYERNCAYTVTKCKMGCSSIQPRSQGTAPIINGNSDGGYGGYQGSQPRSQGTAPIITGNSNGGYGGYQGSQPRSHGTAPIITGNSNGGYGGYQGSQPRSQGTAPIITGSSNGGYGGYQGRK